MFVCMCYGITDKNIETAVAEYGIGNIRELRSIMQLGSQCGQCIETAQAIIDNTIIDESLFKEVS